MHLNKFQLYSVKKFDTFIMGLVIRTDSNVEAKAHTRLTGKQRRVKILTWRLQG